MLDYNQIEGNNLEEKQINIERTLLKQGYDKSVLQAVGSYERASEVGGSSIAELPKGKRLFFDTFSSVQKFLYEAIDSERTKARKSKFYTVLIEPQTLLYTKDLAKKEQYPTYQLKYENPVSLLTYFMTKELTRVMVKEEINLTLFSRKIANAFMAAYNNFGEADDEALTGIIQLTRTFVLTPESKYFETKNYQDGIVVKLKEEFENLRVTKEEIIASITEQSTAFKPMVVEPKPHKNLLDYDGGYIELKSPILKKPEFDEVRQMPFTSTNQGEMFFNAINNIQSTKWSINHEFLNWMKSSTNEHIVKYFNHDVQKMQLELNDYRSKTTNKIIKLKKDSVESRILANSQETEEEKTALVRKCLNLKDEAEELENDIQEKSSFLGKVRGWQETLNDIEFYRNFEYFYHPVFCDNRGRVYTYNTSLSFQGSSLSKTLVQTHETQRLSESGLYELQVLLGGMIDGYDKKSPTVRYNRVQELTEAFEQCITHEDYSVIDLLDEDEVLMALNIAFVLYNHKTNPHYKTGIVAYIDATSSAIQMQGLIQKCKKAAGLTNLLPNSTDDLPDAYKSVANTCEVMCKDISTQTDAELIATLAVFYKENDESKLTYLNIKP